MATVANWLDEDFDISLTALIRRRLRWLQCTRFDVLPPGYYYHLSQVDRSGGAG